MELRNFNLEGIADGIALEGCGRYWDLHAYADFAEVKYFTVENSAELHWRVPNMENPWGDVNNRAKGLILKFSDVIFLKIEQTEQCNTNEDDCVASISQISRPNQHNIASANLRIKDKWKPGEDFGLFFELQSGRTIEIHAASAELIPL